MTETAFGPPPAAVDAIPSWDPPWIARTETILASQVHPGMTLWFLAVPFVVDMIGLAEPDRPDPAGPAEILIRARSATLRAVVTLHVPSGQWVIVDRSQPSVPVRS